MLSDALKRIVADACVTVVTDEGKGRGVLVAGQLILTAAHCVTHTTTGEMVLGDDFLHDIHTHHGILKVGPLGVEPVTDIAVLGALDAQEFPDEAEAFAAWCDAVPPVPLCLDDFPVQEPFPVYIYTHRDRCMEGTATQVREKAYTLWLTVPEGIELGTSGSPVVTAYGAIVGVISVMAGTEGFMRRPHLTLPGWVMRHIQACEDAD